MEANVAPMDARDATTAAPKPSTVLQQLMGASAEVTGHHAPHMPPIPAPVPVDSMVQAPTSTPGMGVLLHVMPFTLPREASHACKRPMMGG